MYFVVNLCIPYIMLFNCLQMHQRKVVVVGGLGHLKYDKRQTFLTQTGDPDRVVTSPGGVLPSVLKMAHTSGRFVYHQVQPQSSQVCMNSSRSKSMEGRHIEPLLREVGHLRISPSGNIRPSGHQGLGQWLPKKDPDAPGWPILENFLTQPANECLHRDLQNLSLCALLLEPKPSKGFSDHVAATIEVAQRHSTRSVHESKCFIFVKWYESSQVDFKSSFQKQILDFLLHLFQEKNLPTKHYRWL